jgi:hypothetical protein
MVELVQVTAPGVGDGAALRTANAEAEASGGAVCAQTCPSTLNMQMTNKSFFISKLLGWISLRCR